MPGATAISLTKPSIFEHKIKIHDLMAVMRRGSPDKFTSIIKTEIIEIFPGVKATFGLGLVSLNLQEFLRRLILVVQADKQDNWIQVKQGFFGIIGCEIISDENPCLAGKVEVDIGGKMTTAGRIGDYEKNEYVQVPKPGKELGFSPTMKIRHEDEDVDVDHAIRDMKLIYMSGDNVLDGKVNLEMKITLYKEEPIKVKTSHELEIPKSLKTKETLSAVGKAIMADDSTADLTVRCGTEVFKVHKTFLSTRSPVFRAMLEHDMEETRTGEILVKDIKVDILRKMFHYNLIML